MSAAVHAPPFMLGERPTPSQSHGVFSSTPVSFLQVPFVRVSERVENGVKVRKQLRKYLKASSHTQYMVAQMHLTDACINIIQPAEFSQSCFQKFFDEMKLYNEKMGEKHLEASKAFLEMTLPLQNSNKSKKWAKEVYNLVQKSVQEVINAEKKMFKAKKRKQKAMEECIHWKKVFEANEATYLVQPNNPEVLKGFELAQTRFQFAIHEEENALIEYEECKKILFSCIEKRDEIVVKATTFSQSIEEDRLDTMLIVFKQFIETKVNILQAEIDAINHMQKLIKEMERESVIQQYILDHMEPTLTHRHAKALSLLEWHWYWHEEQEQEKKKKKKNNNLFLKEEKEKKIKGKIDITPNDIKIIKDFITSCFIPSDQTICSSSSSSSSSFPYRKRFIEPKMAMKMYRIENVRKIIFECLNDQRTISQELSNEGFELLSKALQLVLNASTEKNDTKSIKTLMNMAQTFYYYRSDTLLEKNIDSKIFLQTSFKDHPVWFLPDFWGNALLLTIGEELSKTPQEKPWYELTSIDRTQKVLHVHHVVFGQVSCFLFNMWTFGLTKNQIFQFVSKVCAAYELNEDQKITLFSSIEALQNTTSTMKMTTSTSTTTTCTIDTTTDNVFSKSKNSSTKSSTRKKSSKKQEDNDFTTMILPDWTIQYYDTSFISPSSPTNTNTNTATMSSLTSTIASRFRTFSTNKSFGPTTGRNIEPFMKSTVSSSTASESTVQVESWEDLFGGYGADEGEEKDGGESSEPKMKKVSSRNQLRKARSRPLSFRMDSSEPVVAISSDPEPLIQAPQTTDAISPTKKEKKKNKRMVKAKSATMIDTTCLTADNNLLFNSAKSQTTTVATTTSSVATASATGLVSSTQQDAILAAATLMSKRRKETEKYSTESDTGTLRRTVMNTGNAGSRSDPNKSLPPRSPPLKPGNNQNARSFEKEKQLTTGSVAALRARFEKES